MRWEYDSPEKKLFLVDGKTTWFYVPYDHTVTKAPVKESSDWRTPLALLTGKADLSRLCSQIDLITSKWNSKRPRGPSLSSQASKESFRRE